MAEPASERKEQQIEDREVLGRINELVNEEHELYHRAAKGGLSVREHERLRQLEVNLDRCCGTSSGSAGRSERPATTRMKLR